MSQSAKEILMKMKEEILSEIIDNMKEESNGSMFELGDILDLACDERNRELSLLLRGRDREKLVEIEKALQRMEAGTYGYCEICENNIHENRLKVMPFARLCVPCKSESEKGEPKVKRANQGVIYKKIIPMDNEEKED